MSHIIGQFCRTVADLILQVQKMCVIFNTGIRCDDSDRSGNASVNTVNGSTDPDCIRDVFAVGNGNALFTDGAEFFCQFCGIRLLGMPQDGLSVCPDSGGCIRRSGKPEAPCGSHRSADPSHSQILRRP